MFHFPHYTHATGPFSSLIADDWKLIRFYNDEEGRFLLYNLSDDFEEQNDLAAVYPEKRDALAKQLGGYDHWKAQHDLHVSQRADWAARLEHLRTRPVEHPPGQLHWDAEFAAVSPDDQEWIEAMAGGSPPGDAIALVRQVLGGTTVA